MIMLGCISLVLSTGCMQWAEQAGWTVPVNNKSGKAPSKSYGDATVTVNSNKSPKSNKSKSRNIFQREPETDGSAI